MKNFLKKQFLFDKAYGSLPYFWTIALAFFSVQIVGSVKGTYPRIGITVLLLIYAKFYHDSYELPTARFFKLVIQLVISLIVAAFSNYGTLYVFTAWQIGSMNLNKKTFYRYTALYLLVAIFGITMSEIYDPNQTFYSLSIALFFAIGSPFAAYSLRQTYRRRSQLSQSNERLESLIRQSERGRIAKDLHDNLGQSFSLITLKAELAEKLMSKDQEKAAKELQDIAQTSRDNLSLVREIVTNLNKKTIAEAMIIEEKNLQTAKIFLSTTNENDSVNWPDNVQNVLSAVIKEAVTNIIRHSKANQVNLIFSSDNQAFKLTIKDNGIGIKNKRNNSFGMTGMQQRINSLNGIMEVFSDHGTIIDISIPKEVKND